mmetsp:Transcript_38815/g.124428  ORF Transcript_38815/g.124428 Transcript_38815/m.124428 type:complete len:105 (+) Transcript_38815:342-656(+)
MFRARADREAATIASRQRESVCVFGGMQAGSQSRKKHRDGGWARVTWRTSLMCSCVVVVVCGSLSKKTSGCWSRWQIAKEDVEVAVGERPRASRRRSRTMDGWR